MKNRAAARRMASLFGLIALLGMLRGAAIGRQAKPPVTKPVLSDSQMVKGYKNWARVNAKPHQVYGYLAYLCRGLTPEEAARQRTDPHKDKWVSVYVNAAAKDVMLHKKHPLFPVGSVIVKEKLTRPDSRAPELLTVMRKREPGYNLQNGDWEYLVFNGAGNRITAQGQLTNCQKCHADWGKESDYVSRAYLSQKQRAGLK